jgi:hypothetical protein
MLDYLLRPLKGYASQTTVVYAETEGTCLNSTWNTPRAGRMKYVEVPTSGLGGGLNRSTQHFILGRKDGV